jgi:hypothetical protein
MCSSKGAQKLTVETAAALSESGSHGGEIDNFLGSTIATAIPHSSAVLVSMRKSQRDQSPKANSGDILESRHRDLSRRWLCSETASRFRAEPFRILAQVA